MRPRFLLLFILMVFLFLAAPLLTAIEPKDAHPFTEQKSFNLDFGQKTFDYEQRHLNETGQPSSYTYTYYTAGNKTFWIEIPKNSTIYNSTLTLTGLILVNQTSAGISGAVAVTIGNVTSNPGNEIVLGFLNVMGNDTAVYDGQKNLLWGYDVVGSDETNDVKIGALSGTTNTVIIGSDIGTSILDYDGNQIDNNSIGLVRALDFDEITADSGKEIVAGGDNLYLLNSTLDLVKNSTVVTGVYGLDIGNVTTSPEIQIVVGSGGTGNNKIWLLNFTGSDFMTIWSFTTGDIVNDVAIGNISTDAGNEIIAVSRENKVYAINSTGHSLWNYTLTDYGASVKVGEFADTNPGNEIIVGSGGTNVSNSIIYILNSTGGLILSYGADGYVRGVDIGNVTGDETTNINEVIAVTTGGSIYELNYDAFPTDVTLNAGDGPVDWTYPGKFRTYEVLDDSDNLTSAIQGFLGSCADKVCVVPFLTGSAHKGRLQVSALNISYTYDAKTDIHNQTVSPAWAKTQGVMVNESVINEAVNVSYTEPALNISINYMKINSGATSCGFKNEVYSVVDLSGEDYCNVTSKGIRITPLSYDYIHLLWDNTMGTGIPILLNESQPYNTSVTDSYLWIKNITIWSNVTGESFTNIIANTSLNDAIAKGNAFLNVTWNGTVYNITPQTQCPTMGSVGNGFTACYDDVNINGKVDFFQWTQPNASAGSIVFYQAGGSRNLVPNMTSPTVTPSSGLWGENFNFSIAVNDGEGDSVNVKLWVYANLTEGWQMKEMKNLTGSGTLSFNTTSERTWVGSNQYKFEYYDYNPANISEIYHSPINTSQNTGPLVERHNITLQHSEGNNTNVSREYGETSRTLMVYMNDSTGYSDWTNESCLFLITFDGSQSDWGHYEYVNNTGYCSHSFNPNGSYSVGQQTWNSSLNQSYYNITNPQNYVVRVMGHMGIVIQQPSQGSNVVRNQSHNFVAYISDEYGKVVNSSSINTSQYNCTFYFNGTNIGTSGMNSSGYCSVSWTPNCTYQILNNYDVNVTLGGQDSLNYTVLSNQTGASVRLVDYPAINIIQPQTGSAFYKGAQMALNATVNDTCYTCTVNSYNITWYVNYPYVAANFSSLNISRTNEPFMLTGEDLNKAGANLTTWKANDTKVECGGAEVPAQVVSPGTYMDAGSEIVFLFNLSSGSTETCYIFHNESNSLDNSTIDYLKDGSFESGDTAGWNCSACTNIYCNCTVAQVGGETNGNYALVLSADNSASRVSQILDYPLSSQYLKVRFKAWGEYGAGSYLRITGGGGTCELTPGAGDITYGSAVWNTTTCNVTSFSGATSINISVNDIGSGGADIDASHVYVDYLCVADPSGNCITLDTGATEGIVYGRENITLPLVNSTEDIWTIPIYHPVGSYTIFANLTGDYYLSAENESYVDIFGLANVSYFNFTPVVEGECEGDLCFTGVDITLLCRASDKNTTQGIYNFTTNFYNDSTYIGSAQTNGTGYAEFLWAGSTSFNGTHTIKCNISDSPNLYYNVTEENYMEFNITFESSVTNGTMNVAPNYAVMENLTKQNNDTAVFNVTVNNTGTGNMFGISVVVYNKTGIWGMKNICGYLPPGGSCAGNVTVEASREAVLGNNSLNMSLVWTNPDPIGPGFENDTVVINATNTTFLNLIEDGVNVTMPYGSTYYSSFRIEDFGNTGLENATFSLYGGNSSTLYSWLGLNGTAVNQTFFPVARLSESLVNISVTIPDNDTYMGKVYWAYLLSEEEATICAESYEDCNDTLLLTINVTQQDWTLQPKNDTMRIAGLSCNNHGTYNLINVTNQREFNLTLNVTEMVKNSTGQEKGYEFFNITLSSSGTTIPLPDSPFNITPFSSAYINITYDVSGANSSDADTYEMNLSFRNLEPATVPQWVNITRALMVSDFEVAIISPNQSSPAGPVSPGQNITIYANATLGEDQHLNDSLVWRVWIGETDCPVSWNTSNTTGAPLACDWIINCSAPLIPGNPVNNTLVLSGNYTVLPIDFNDTEEGAVIYNDTQAPRIWTVEVIPEGQVSSTAVDNDPNVDYQRENTTLLLIRVNITDNNQTTSALMNVSKDGLNILTNAALTKIGSYWEQNITNPAVVGDYKVDVYANDSNGNSNNTWNAVTGYFDIYKNMTFRSNFTYPGGEPIDVELSFYKPETSWMLHENSSSFFNITVHKRSYDIRADTLGHTIILQNADLNYSSQNQFSEPDPGNITDPFRLDYFPTYASPQINIMPSKFEDPIMGIVIEPANLSSSGGGNLSANITLNYTEALQAALSGGKSINQQNLEVLECSNWNYATRNCEGGLENGDYIAVTPSGGLINFQTTISSAYIVAEGCYANGELIDCSGFEDIEIPSSGGGGRDTREEEKVTSFSIQTNLDSRSFGDIVMYPGETEEYWLYVTNKLGEKITPSLSPNGSIKDFLSFSETSFDLESGQSKRVAVTIYIPEKTPLGTYSGSIIVRAQGETDEIPVVIKVVKRDEGEIMLEVNIIKKTLEVGESLKFQVKLRNMGTEKELKPVLTYLIKEGDTDRLIKEETENVTLEKMLSFTKTISLNETGIEEGEYLLEVWAEIDGKAVNYMETFDLVKPFLATTLGVTLLYTLLILSIVIATIFIRKYYVSWKVGRDAKKRYIFPVDMTKIPQKTEKAFWVGTIAGSKIKAWFNPDDLTTHALVAGATGSGKSVGASIIVEEALDQKIPVIVFDPTAQWTGFVRGCKDNNLLKYYPSFGMDTRNVRPYKGMIFEMSDPKQNIEFKEFMNPGEITVFTLNNLKPEEFDEAVRNIIDSMFRVKWEEATGLKMLVVFDEVHRLLEKYGGKGGYVALEKACREFRKWGIGLIMCSQVLADFKEAVSGNVLTDVQLNTKSLEDISKAREKYGESYAKRITRQGLGVGMIHNPKYNDGKPYFIQFRPTWHNPHKITNEELEEYKQFALELKEIRKDIEEMEKQGREMFDIKLELKLAEDKLKLGNFRMAKIYIASLKKSLSGGA